MSRDTAFSVSALWSPCFAAVSPGPGSRVQTGRAWKGQSSRDSRPVGGSRGESRLAARTHTTAVPCQCDRQLIRPYRGGTVPPASRLQLRPAPASSDQSSVVTRARRCLPAPAHHHQIPIGKPPRPSVPSRRPRESRPSARSLLSCRCRSFSLSTTGRLPRQSRLSPASQLPPPSSPPGRPSWPSPARPRLSGSLSAALSPASSSAPSSWPWHALSPTGQGEVPRAWMSLPLPMPMPMPASERPPTGTVRQRPVRNPSLLRYRPSLLRTSSSSSLAPTRTSSLTLALSASGSRRTLKTTTILIPSTTASRTGSRPCWHGSSAQTSVYAKGSHPTTWSAWHSNQGPDIMPCKPFCPVSSLPTSTCAALGPCPCCRPPS